MRDKASTAGGYRGHDRRARFKVEPPPATANELMRLGGVIVIAVVVSSASALAAGANLPALLNVVHTLASISGTAAGAAMLMCWRIGGRALPGWLAVAFLNLGLLNFAYWTLQEVDPDGAAGDPFGRLVTCLFPALCIAAAMAAPEVDSRLRPVRNLVATGMLGVAALGGTELVTWWWESPRWVGVATRSASGAVWMALAVATFVARRRNPAVAGPWVPAFLLTLSCAQGLSAAISDIAASPAVADIGFLAASSLAMGAASRELGWMFRRQDRHSLSLRAAADRLRGQIHDERAELDEQLHDLRNAVTGIRNAHLTLGWYADRLDGETRAHLFDSVTAELSRLQGLIDPGRSLQSEELDLGAVLAPLVTTARTNGTVVHVDVAGRMVRSDRAALAQVFQNLLLNARTHAGGAQVRIVAERAGDVVRVLVADDGPGVTADDQSRIFDRGFRGAAAAAGTGSGLGLFIVRRLLADMGGGIELASGDGGACFVIQLPAANAAAVESSLRSATRGKDLEKRLELAILEDLHRTIGPPQAAPASSGIG